MSAAFILGQSWIFFAAIWAKALFKVPNNGGYETTPEEEWNFVVNPDLAETYPGGRRGTKLDVYNLAHGAQKHGGAHLDIPLDIADNRLAEVAKQNACSAEKLVDSVKTVALRCGLGFFQLRHAFADGREIVIKVLHQRRGPIVGGEFE